MNILQTLKSHFIKHPEEEQVLETVEEIMAFMDENELKLQENPFERKSKKSIIINIFYDFIKK